MISGRSAFKLLNWQVHSGTNLRMLAISLGVARVSFVVHENGMIWRWLSGRGTPPEVQFGEAATRRARSSQCRPPKSYAKTTPLAVAALLYRLAAGPVRRH